MSIVLPDRDEAAEQRVVVYEQMKRALEPMMDVVFEEFITNLTEVSNQAQHPLHTLLMDLAEAPLTDRFDLAGWLRYVPMSSKVKLADAVMQALGQAQIAVVQSYCEVPF
jgi:hypothetical protein